MNESPAIRDDIAGLAVEALVEGRQVYVTINNKAEGSAPVSVERLAAALVQRLAGVSPPAAPGSGGRR